MREYLKIIQFLVHRFGRYLNSHIYYHVLVTDGIFSADQDGEAESHPALDLDDVWLYTPWAVLTTPVVGRFMPR